MHNNFKFVVGSEINNVFKYIFYKSKFVRSFRETNFIYYNWRFPWAKIIMPGSLKNPVYDINQFIY